MSTAKYTATLPIPPLASLSTKAPRWSIRCTSSSPGRAGRSEGWDTLSRQYIAMKAECAKCGLRACAFPHFREVLRRLRKNSPELGSRCHQPHDAFFQPLCVVLELLFFFFEEHGMESIRIDSFIVVR